MQGGSLRSAQLVSSRQRDERRHALAPDLADALLEAGDLDRPKPSSPRRGRRPTRSHERLSPSTTLARSHVRIGDRCICPYRLAGAGATCPRGGRSQPRPGPLLVECFSASRGSAAARKTQRRQASGRSPTSCIDAASRAWPSPSRPGSPSRTTSARRPSRSRAAAWRTSGAHGGVLAPVMLGGVLGLLAAAQAISIGARTGRRGAFHLARCGALSHERSLRHGPAMVDSGLATRRRRSVCYVRRSRSSRLSETAATTPPPPSCSPSACIASDQTMRISKRSARRRARRPARMTSSTSSGSTSSTVCSTLGGASTHGRRSFCEAL